MFRWIYLTVLTVQFGLLFLLRKIGLYGEPAPKLVRLYLQEAGGAFVKIGQLLALRHEILPPEYCWELSELFDNVTPMPFDHVRKTIVGEFGSEPHEIFSLIEEQPVASASFAQVHRATLPDGKVVAVKIQRPNLASMVRSDFNFLKLVSILASPYFTLKAIPIGEVLQEIQESTLRELDYRLEKDNAEMIRSTLEANSAFVIPHTYAELTSNHVLVQDFIVGTKLNDVLRAKRSGIPETQLQLGGRSLDEIALDLIDEISRQYFLHGIYHADPHPGNIIITPAGKIALVDFGIVGKVKHFNRALFWDFVKHVAVEVDHKEAAQAFLRLGLRPVEDRIRFLLQGKGTEDSIEALDEIIDGMAETYQRSLQTVVDNWTRAMNEPSESMYNRSSAVALLKVMRLVEQYNVHFQRDIILFLRTLIIADMMAMQISANFRMHDALKRFAKHHETQVKALEDLIKDKWVTDNEDLTDPWNQDVRDKTKDYIFDWFQRLTDDRPELLEKIKEPAKRLRQAL